MDRSRLNRQEIIGALSVEPWAIHMPALRRAIAMEWPADPWSDADPEAIAAMYAARGDGRMGTVAVVPITGHISKRDSLFTLLTGGTSTTRLSATLRALAGDESVATILLDVDSPGGTVSGLPEAAASIRKAGGSKRVVAIVNPMTASAAYWLASQAGEMVATPEAMVGSIGAFTMHLDWSRALDEMGITPTFIKAGRRKVDGNEMEPLTDEARHEMQAIIDQAMSLFVADVAKGRGVTPATVRSAEWGEGAILTAKDAKAVGMVDAIATYSETVARLAGGKSLGMRADLKWMSKSTFQQVEAEHRDFSGVLAQRAAAFEAQVLSKEAEEAEIVERGPLARTWGWRARSVTR